MQKILIFFLSLLLFYTSLDAYQSESKLQAVIIGKIAKYISWKEKVSGSNFIITVLNNPFGSLWNDLYHNKKLKSQHVVIRYIDSIDAIGRTNILYIPDSDAYRLNKILASTKGKNILTISDIRGFAEKNGAVQISFVSQKVKLKINLDVVKQSDLNVKSTLLRIADVIQEGK